MEEREQLAHEMHDTLAQSFAGVGYYLQSIRRSLRGLPQLPGDVLNDLDVACKMATGTHLEASASIAALHPGAHDEGDLLTLLERTTCSMLGGERIPITLRREGSPRSISPAVTNALFHVGREAISNVLRHSQATAMMLCLCFQPKHVSLTIEDNGAGFQAGTMNAGFGLQSMRRRCRAIGAELEVKSNPGAGCAVTVNAPTRRRIFGAKWRGARLQSRQET
jgi:signal transduction histidine kinase